MHNSDSKTIYRLWVQDERPAALPIFFEPDWLDLFGNWNVCIVNGKNGNIEGVLPYSFEKKWGQTFINLPPLCPYLGPYLVYPDFEKNYSRYSFENRVLEALIKQLPNTFFYKQKWVNPPQNGQAFLWNKFRLHTAYTYIINDIKNLERVWSGFKKSVRNKIKQAETEYEVLEKNDPELFWRLHKQVYDLQKMHVPYTQDVFNKVYHYGSKTNRGKLFFAFNQKKEAVAALFLVNDQESVYLLGSGRTSNEEAKVSSLLVWNAIKHYSTVVDQFNFEGSIIKRIATFNQSFGGELIPYLLVYKYQNRWVEALHAIRRNAG